jgi:hypothetical protein
LYLCLDTENLSTAVDHVGSNTVLSYAGAADNWSYSVQAFGEAEYINGKQLDVGTLDASTSSASTIDLFVTETNLTLANLSEVIMTFGETYQDTLNETRTFYLDTTNNGLLTVTLGSFGYNGSSGPLYKQLIAELTGITGKFSITEEISLTGGANGGDISADDDFRVPEPVTLGLFGMGLLGMAALRRRKSAKSA